MSSFRLIAGFFISFKAADWILVMGFIKTFSIYSAIMLLFSLMLPLVYIYGKRMRLWSARQFELAEEAEEKSRVTSIELTKS